VTETIDRNSGGTITPDAALTGAYVVAASGRGVITQTGSNPVFYVISPTKVLALDLASAAPSVEEIVH